MKRLICVLLLITAIIALFPRRYEYYHSEDKLYYNGTNMIFRCTLEYDKVIDIYYKYYPDNDTVIYFPVSGEYKTWKGEKFRAEVSDIGSAIFLEDAKYSRIVFTIKIYNENDELIMEKENFCSYVQTDTKARDLTYVSVDFRDYWRAMSVRSDKYKE